MEGKGLKVKLAMFRPDGRDDRPWNWAVRFWAFMWRWTGRGYPWIRGYAKCHRCGVDACDVEFEFERIGRGRLVCMPGGDCYEDRLLASIPGFQSDQWTEVDDIPTATHLETRGLVTPLQTAEGHVVYQRTRAGDFAANTQTKGSGE